MMKKILISIILLALAAGMYGCGSGSASVPGGENPGTPSEIQLEPAQFIAQTNSSIYFHARVLDGNGHPLQNIPVFFTNCAPFGTLSSTSATTDNDGFATVSLFSSMTGFATIQAEMNIGSNKVRDRKTVFFSSFAIALPPGQSSTASMSMDVDSDFDGTFNETADFTLLDTANDDQAMIRVTTNGAGDSVLIGSDDTEEVKFMPGETSTATVTTDSQGQATALIKVVPTFLTPATRVVNINASCASNGAAGMISLFLAPVSIKTITVAANPKTVDSGGSSDITANVVTSAGTPAPDGTTVSFSAALGGVDPFVQTTGGLAKAKYKAPKVTATTSDTVTAKAGGISGSVTIGITVPPPTPPTPAALAVNPTSATLTCASPGTATFLVSGGTTPYTIAKSVTSDPITATPTSSGFTVSISGTCVAGDYSLLVSDSSNPINVITVKITLK